MSKGRSLQSSFKISKKKRGIQNQVRKLILKKKEMTDLKEISKNIKAFCETLSKQNSSKLMPKNKSSLKL